MRNTYQQAVLDLLLAGEAPEKVIKGLRSTLTSRGHEALLPSVLRSVLRDLEARPVAGATVVLAKPEDEKKFANVIRQALASLEEGAVGMTAVIDPTIIGGFIAKGRDRIIDHSYKQKLVQLYQRLTT